MKLRVCPKCGGKLRLMQDEYGSFINCLHCGFMRDLRMIVSRPVNPPLTEAGLRSPDNSAA